METYARPEVLVSTDWVADWRFEIGDSRLTICRGGSGKLMSAKVLSDRQSPSQSRRSTWV
jgi:hypothetical protein